MDSGEDMPSFFFGAGFDLKRCGFQPHRNVKIKAYGSDEIRAVIIEL
jgi:hypothetical protein